MKIQSLIFFLFFTINASVGLAQKKFTTGSFKVQGREFSVKVDTGRFSGIRILDVEVKNIKLIAPSERALPIRRQDMEVDTNKINLIFDKYLGVNKCKVIKNNELITLLLTFNQAGEVISSGYALRYNTLLTPTQIGFIDSELRRSIRATFVGDRYKEYLNISFPHFIKYYFKDFKGFFYDPLKGY